jgi:hypothetical protein
MKNTISQQNKFELQICKLLGYTKYVCQNDENSCQMIIESIIDDELLLSGTIATREKSDGTCDFLLVSTKDSEVNHIEIITLKMIRQIIMGYSSIDAKTKKRNKIVLATNIPLELHSHTEKEFKNKYNFEVIKIGYSFCEKHSLEFTEVY